MGMVGFAIVRRLSKENGLETLTRPRGRLDLFNQRSVLRSLLVKWHTLIWSSQDENSRPLCVNLIL